MCRWHSPLFCFCLRSTAGFTVSTSRNTCTKHFHTMNGKKGMSRDWNNTKWLQLQYMNFTRVRYTNVHHVHATLACNVVVPGPYTRSTHSSSGNATKATTKVAIHHDTTRSCYTVVYTRHLFTRKSNKKPHYSIQRYYEWYYVWSIFFLSVCKRLRTDIQQ